MSRKNRIQPARKPKAGMGAVALAAAGLLLLGLAAFALWRGASTPKVTPEVTGAPKLKVDKSDVDLGNVQLGQTVEVAFELTNAGDRQLRFTDVPYVEVVEGC
jgi:hypothetical protein